jgi:hypothetical protein
MRHRCSCARSACARGEVRVSDSAAAATWRTSGFGLCISLAAMWSTGLLVCPWGLALLLKTKSPRLLQYGLERFAESYDGDERLHPASERRVPVESLDEQHRANEAGHCVERMLQFHVLAFR